MKKFISLMLSVSVLLACFPNVYADETSDAERERQELLDSDEYKSYLDSQGRDNSDLSDGGAAVNIYASPGALGGDGTFEKPLGDIDSVMEKLKEVLAQSKVKSEVRVILRGGDYRVDSTYTLDKLYSGFDNDHRVIFMPYENEKPVIKGSKKLDISKLEPVTNANVLKRLDSDAKSKIGVLDLKAQGITNINQIPDDLNSYTRIYLDNKEQMLSQWPNGDYNFANFNPISSGGWGKKNKGGTFQYVNTERPSRWKMAEDIIISGFLGINFAGDSVPVASIDTDNSQIVLKYGASYGIAACATRRWKAVNLLEEIDVPGEWYIDRDNMLLYYYPPYGLQSSVMEISDFGNDLFKLKGVSNLTFKGIKFSEFCGNIFVNSTDPKFPLENFTIDHCDFENINGSVFKAETYEFSSFWDNADWQYRDANIKNIEISNNILYNICSEPFGVVSGSVEKLRDDGFVFRNNYANQPSAYSLQACALMLGSFSGYGLRVENNLAHNGLFHAMNFLGSEIKINNNELSNAVRETMDAGTIYSGRTTIPRNNEISYNYFIGAAPVQQQSYAAKADKMIYFDDQEGGARIHHNTGVAINLGGDYFASASGDNVQFESNTIVGMSGIQQDPRGINFHERLFENFADNLFFQNYIKKYPEIKKEYDIHKTVGYSTTLFGAINDNYFVNCGTIIRGNSETMKKYNEYSNNTVETDESLNSFVDPEHYDYRVKKDSAAYKANPNLVSEDYDLSKIGIQWEEFGKDRIINRRSFRKLYPANGATNVKTVNLEFAWEKSFDADRYRFVLATDPDFKNIVSEQNCMYNYCTVDLLQSDYTDYYWTVFAINDTMQLNGEWEAYGAVHRFTTSKYEFLQYEELESTIEKVTKSLNYIKDGTVAGTYTVGTRERVESALEEAKQALTWKIGEKRQRDIDEIREKLEKSFTNDDLNPGFLNLGEYLSDSSKWIVRPGSENNVEFDGGTLKMHAVKGDEKPPTQVYVETQEVNIFSQKSFFSFDAKLDFTENSGFVGFSVRGNDIGTDLWGCENYFFCIKPDVIEIQAWTGSNGGVIKTIENGTLADKEWHTVSFGAYDCDFGQLILMMIDNEIVAKFMHTSSTQITRQGGLKFDIYGKINMDIKSAEKIPDIEFKPMINELVEESLGELSGKLCESVGKGSTLFYKDSKYFYMSDKMIKRERAVLRNIDGTSVVGSDIIPEMLGAEVVFDNGMITVKGKNCTVIYSLGSTDCTIGGESTKAAAVPFEENGIYYLPLRQLSEALGYNLAYSDGLIVVNNSMVLDLVNRADYARKVISAMEKMRRIEEDE